MSRLERNSVGWGASLALLICMPMTGTSGAAESPGVGRLSVSVEETAGIRRFDYPVSVELPLAEPLKKTGHLRLLEKGKPITAQFWPQGDDHHGIRTANLDFSVSLAPYETRAYVVEYGNVSAGPQPKGGLEIETSSGEFRVHYPGELEFVVPRSLLGLLRQVRTPKTEYLRPGSPGLMIRYKDNIHYRAGGFGPSGEPTVARVVKPGPLALALRFESTEALRGGRSVRSVVDMEFPRSKSWVRVTWNIDDPNGYIAGLGADLNLNLQAEPTLVDFGAGTLVYAQLSKGQRAVLRQNHSEALGATPDWQTLVGPTAAPIPYVVEPRPPIQMGVGPLSGSPLPRSKAEGWAHVMDRQRCTAVAVADFAEEGKEAEITIDADGRLQVWRHCARDGKRSASGSKTLRFWLHFVGMPVHVGAVTSPQAMLAPLKVRVSATAK